MNRLTRLASDVATSRLFRSVEVAGVEEVDRAILGFLDRHRT